MLESQRSAKTADGPAVKRIAITGAPAAGKTALVESLFLEFSDQLAVVCEAASFLFRAGLPRPREDEQQKVVERLIYHTQTALEDLAALQRPGRVLLCDRGTLDGLAYWPGTVQDYFSVIGSSRERELARYQWVLHLDAAAPFDLQPNTLRIESSDEIFKLNERLQEAWRSHPRRLVIPASMPFLAKLDFATTELSRILSEGVGVQQAGQNEVKTKSIEGLLCRRSESEIST